MVEIRKFFVSGILNRVVLWLRRYIEYCMHRVNMLRHYGVQPVLVFDGGGLPMKSDQEIKRARFDFYCLRVI